MRSFFRRPSWATRGDDNTSADFYRRSDQTYADIIAASKEARENLADVSGGNPAKDNKGHKRRRISHDASRSSRDTSPSGLQECQPIQVDREDQSLAVDLQYVPSKDRATKSLTPMRPETSFLRGNDPDPAVLGASEQRHPSSSCAAPHSFSPNSEHANRMSYSETNEPPHQYSPKNAVHTGETTPRNSPTHEDVTFQILITSELEHTKPLIVQRKMSQSLKDVRLAWCSHQNLPKEIQSTVYLTWRGKRLFDVTTCKSLGIGVGSPIMDDCLQYDDGKARVHMEAVSDGLPMPIKKRRLSLDSAPSGSDVIARPMLNRITLKCPTLPGLGIGIASDAKISELITKFRYARDIPSVQDLYLTFDGDRLEPDKCLADYDIADDDLVDVIIR